MLLWIAAAWAVDDPGIQDHLLVVAETLREETPDDLSASQRAARGTALDALEQYAWAGDFPDNPGFARAAWPERASRVYEPVLDGPRAPVFVDDAGTHCAVGYLMALDAPGLVTRIDAAHHTDYLAEIATPGLADDVQGWAEAHGFTVEELAWIQPTYTPVWVPTCEELPEPGPTAAVLAPGDACEPLQSAFLVACTDTCDGALQIQAPVVWEGDDPTIVTLDLGLLGRIEQEVQPGVATWVGTIEVTQGQLDQAFGDLRTTECTVSVGGGVENGAVDLDACTESAGCSTGQSSSSPLWSGLGLLIFRRRR